MILVHFFTETSACVGIHFLFVFFLPLLCCYGNKCDYSVKILIFSVAFVEVNLDEIVSLNALKKICKNTFTSIPRGHNQ